MTLFPPLTLAITQSPPAQPRRPAAAPPSTSPAHHSSFITHHSPIRALLIAEAANPALTSAALVGWQYVRAMGKVADVHIVTELRNRQHFLDHGLIEGQDFTAIDARASQGTAWRIATLLRGGTDLGWTTYAAATTLAYPFFEKALWKQLGPRIQAGEWDLVHRILPLSPVTPSWLSKKLDSIHVPFIVGPLNGGVPWPKAFAHLQKKEGEWMGHLRTFARFLPGAKATRDHASALIVGSRTTLREIHPNHKAKTLFLPENAIDLARFPWQDRPAPVAPLKVAFVGRLVPLKGVDMLLEAAAPLIKTGALQLDIIGDGPERPALQAQAQALGIAQQVALDGWVQHADLSPRLRQSHIFAFPSVREFGGGAVLEAMALGLVPIVLDHGGPVELIPPGTGFSIPVTTRAEIVIAMRHRLELLSADPAPLAAMGLAARAHIEKYYTWENKAAQTQEIYRWVLGRRETKPNWGVPFGFADP